jgi:hypothetical protein
MAMLQDLRRVRQEEIDSDNRWQLAGAYEAERRQIDNWIKLKAREASSAPEATVKTALDAGGTYVATVASIFGRREEVRDPVLLAKARLGMLAREAPSKASLFMLAAMTIMAMVLELGVFIAIWLYGEGDPMVVVNGGLLALGGWFGGHGAGNLIGFADETGNRIRGSAANWGAVGVGGLAVSGIALIRASGEEEGAFLVVLFTTIVAVLVAVLEALGTSARDKYRDRWDKMFMAQSWHATERHIEEIGRGYWEKVYDTEVRQLEKDRDLALRKPGVAS